MPELPDIELYLHALGSRIVGQRLERIRLASPFLVRSFDPPIDQANGKTVLALRRLGKRVVWELEGDLFLVIHLMIAGRFKWLDRGAKIPGKVGLAAFDFENGTLVLTEALSIASNRALLSIAPEEHGRVWYWNGEDPLEELERRVHASAIHHKLVRDEIEGRLRVHGLGARS